MHAADTLQPGATRTLISERFFFSKLGKKSRRTSTLAWQSTLALAWVLAGVGCGERSGVPAVTSGEIASSAVACFGRIVPCDGVVELAAPYALGGGPAVVGQIHVHRGEAVSAGRVLATMHPHPAALAEVAAAAAGVARREAELARVHAGAKPAELAALRAASGRREVEREHARETFTRLQALHTSGSASEADRDTAARALQAAERALEAARAEAEAAAEVRMVDVKVAEAALAEARAQQEAAEARAEAQLVRAPGAGTVIETHRQAGEAGVGTLFEFAPAGPAGVEAYVYDSDIRYVRVGALAKFTGAAFAGEWRGTVTEVGTVVMPNLLRPLGPDTPADRRVVKVLLAIASAHRDEAARLNRHEVAVTIER